jgi:hypothetical protein
MSFTALLAANWWDRRCSLRWRRRGSGARRTSTSRRVGRRTGRPAACCQHDKQANVMSPLHLILCRSPFRDTSDPSGGRNGAMLVTCHWSSWCWRHDIDNSKHDPTKQLVQFPFPGLSLVLSVPLSSFKTQTVPYLTTSPSPGGAVRARTFLRIIRFEPTAISYWWLQGEMKQNHGADMAPAP